MPIKLIIFDLDGTLVDTARALTESLNHAIRPHGLGPVSVEETIELIGEGTTRLIEKALEKPLGTPEAAVKEDALKSFLKYYSEHLCVHSTAYPNVRETLRRLPAFNKVVLSNKREDLSVKLLEDLGLKGFFTLIAGSDTTGAKKPSPEAVRYMLEKTGTVPAGALMVGDSPYDIEAASGAGVTTVAATWGYRDRSLLAGADYTMEDIGELMPLLIKLKAIEEKRGFY